MNGRGVCFASRRVQQNLPPEVSEQIDPHSFAVRTFRHAFIDPSAEFAVELQETLGSDLSRWRRPDLDRRMSGGNFVLASAVTATWSDHLPRSCVSQCSVTNLVLVFQVGSNLVRVGKTRVSGSLSKSLAKKSSSLGTWSTFNMHLLLVPLIPMHNPCWLQLPKK